MLVLLLLVGLLDGGDGKDGWRQSVSSFPRVPNLSIWDSIGTKKNPN